MNLNLELNAEQTLALTACMLVVSEVDGVHPAETALIRQFYESGGASGLPAFDTLKASHAQAVSQLEKLAAKGGDFGQALVSLCLMTAYADGSLSDAEREAVLGFGRVAGVDEARFETLLQEVRDSLLGSLASLPDAQSVAALAKEL